MAGGTGGHVFPGLAVADAFRSKGFNIHWMGAHGIEKKLVPSHDIPLFSLSIQGLRGKGIVGWFKLPFNLWRAVREAMQFLKRIQPCCVIGFGGFASGPGGIAAKLLRIPLFIHEQNAAAGLTNKMLSHISKIVFTGFPLPQIKHAQYVGNPVRSSLWKIPSPTERIKTDESNRPLKLLVIGGSQGARALNRLIPNIAHAINRPLEIWHQTGDKLYEDAKYSWDAVNEVPYKLAPFIENMDEAYTWADLIICRAGALTLAELTAVGLGSILIPFPYAVDDHQTKNAAYLKEAGAAYLFLEQTLALDDIVDIIEKLSFDQCLEMANHAKQIAKPNTVEEIVTAIMENCGLDTTQGNENE